MFAGKPIIGLTGGIGSGKSFVAKLFGEAGCVVIDSDEQVRQVYQRPDVQKTLIGWWGPNVIDEKGQINRSMIGGKIFSDPLEKSRLESLLHPLVNQVRDQAMERHANDPQVLAFVWDTPLLLEANLKQKCDAVVFVEAPEALRLERVKTRRGWDAQELVRREKLQMPLDKKRKISDYVISNAAGADQVRVQVRDVLSRILAGLAPSTGLSS